MKTAFICLLLLSNAYWIAAYFDLDQSYKQEMGLRDEAESYIRTHVNCIESVSQ